MRYSAISISIIVFSWWLFSATGTVSPLLLPSPLIVGQNLTKLIVDGTLNLDIQSTIYRFFIGYIGGVLTGIPIGLLMGMSRLSYKILEFPVDFFRSLPVTSLFPLFLLCFGIGDSSKIAMVWVGVIFIIIVNSAYGVMQAPPKRLQMAKSFRASRWQIFRDIVIWEAIPQTVVGMRIALSTALIVVIISEMFLGTQYGLGQRLFDAYSKNLVEEMYSMILIVGFLGYVVNKIFLIAEQKILFWVGK
jgi:ABC-type nitrate/sulfonate/bicarbonate transport system permease component